MCQWGLYTCLSCGPQQGWTGCLLLLSSLWFMDGEIGSIGHSSKRLGILWCCVLVVIYPPLLLLSGRVLGWKGSLDAHRSNKRVPGPHGEEGRPIANRFCMDEEEGPGDAVPFGFSRPFVMATIQPHTGKVSDFPATFARHSLWW